MEIQELKNIVLSGHERTDVDFKCSKPWEGEFRYKLIKAVLAFSNAGGGYIVIGVDDGQNKSDNEFSGISKDDRSTWDVTKVNRFINNFADPSLDIILYDVPLEEEEIKLLILEIPTHRSTPHVCVKDKHNSSQKCLLRKGAVYFRSRDKECIEISDPDDWNELIKRCVISRREELLRDFQQILEVSTGAIATEKQIDIVDADEFDRFTSESDKYKPSGLEAPVYREIICYPKQAWRSVSLDSVKAALKSACVDYKGWPYLFFFKNSKSDPMFGENQISAVNNRVLDGRPTMYYWAFDYDRGIFYSRELTPESACKKSDHIDPKLQVKLLVEAIIAMGRLFDSLDIGLDKRLRLVTRLSPLKGAKMASLDNLYDRIYPSDPYTGNSVSVVIEVPLVDFTTKAPTIATECIIELLKKMGARNLPQSKWFEKQATDRLSNPKKIPDSMIYTL